MQISVTFRHLEASEGVKDYIDKRFKRLKKYMGNFKEIHVILSQERYRYIAETTLIMDGNHLNSQAKDSDLYKAIDDMVEKLERQIRESKLKVKRKRSTSTSSNLSYQEIQDSIPEQEEMDLISLIKKRRRLVKPMSIEEAVAQLNLANDRIFFFINSDSGQINALYKLEDGGYEWIEPQSA